MCPCLFRAHTDHAEATPDLRYFFLQGLRTDICACRTSARKQPDLVIVSTGLWHMLHITDPDGFTVAVRTLRQLSTDFMNAQVCHVLFALPLCEALV